MNGLERFLIKLLFKVKENYSQVNYDSLDRIITKIKEMTQ